MFHCPRIQCLQAQSVHFWEVVRRKSCARKAAVQACAKILACREALPASGASRVSPGWIIVAALQPSRHVAGFERRHGGLFSVASSDQRRKAGQSDQCQGRGFRHSFRRYVEVIKVAVAGGVRVQIIKGRCIIGRTIKGSAGCV